MQTFIDHSAIPEEAERMARIAAGWKAYYGKLEDPLRVRLNQSNDNVKANFLRPIVNKSCAFIWGSGIQFDIPENQVATDWLRLCWKANSQNSLLNRVSINGAVGGHVFLRVLPPVPPARPFPRVVLLDPALVTVRWSEEDFEDIQTYSIQWKTTLEDGVTGAMRCTLISQEHGRWRVQDMLKGTNGGFSVISDVMWPYAWAPIFAAQNLPSPNEYYGVPDLTEDVIEIQRAINFAFSNTNRILRSHAHPKTVATGVANNSLLKTAPDETICLPNGATLMNLEMRSDLSASLEFLKTLKRALHTVSQCPELTPEEVSGIGTLSGLALQILYQSLVEKTDLKRTSYGNLLERVNSALLEMGGLGAALDTQIKWPRMLPADPAAEAQTALMYEQLGVSDATILAQLGFDADSEMEQNRAENAVAMENATRQFNAGREVPGSGYGDNGV